MRGSCIVVLIVTDLTQETHLQIGPMRGSHMVVLVVTDLAQETHKHIDCTTGLHSGSSGCCRPGGNWLSYEADKLVTWQMYILAVLVVTGLAQETHTQIGCRTGSHCGSSSCNWFSIGSTHKQIDSTTSDHSGSSGCGSSGDNWQSYEAHTGHMISAHYGSSR